VESLSKTCRRVPSRTLRIEFPRISLIGNRRTPESRLPNPAFSERLLFLGRFSYSLPLLATRFFHRFFLLLLCVGPVLAAPFLRGKRTLLGCCWTRDGGQRRALRNRVSGPVKRERLRAGNDTGAGGSANDTLAGGLVGDELYGDEDSDFLVGHIGDDTITGGTGEDKIGPAKAGTPSTSRAARSTKPTAVWGWFSISHPSR